jgi:hypothetical protein
MSDDTETRRRAARLREQIAELPENRRNTPGTKQDPPAAPDSGQRRNAPRVRPASPREFVERRMRELDRGGNGEKN